MIVQFRYISPSSICSMRNVCVWFFILFSGVYTDLYLISINLLLLFSFFFPVLIFCLCKRCVNLFYLKPFEATCSWTIFDLCVLVFIFFSFVELIVLFFFSILFLCHFFIVTSTHLSYDHCITWFSLLLSHWTFLLFLRFLLLVLFGLSFDL